MSLNKKTLLLSGALVFGAFSTNAQDAGTKEPVVRNYTAYHDVDAPYRDIAVEDSVQDMLGQGRLVARKLDETLYQVVAKDMIGPGKDILHVRSCLLESQDDSLEANEIVEREVFFAQERTPYRLSRLHIMERMDTMSNELRPVISGSNWADFRSGGFRFDNKFKEVSPLIPVVLEDRSEEEHRLFNYDQLVSYLEGAIHEYGAEELFRNVELLDEAAEKAKDHYILIRSGKRLGIE